MAGPKDRAPEASKGWWDRLWPLGVWGAMGLASCVARGLNFNRWDNFNYFTPMLMETHGQWLAGHIPYWNEHQHMGEPLLANGMSGAMYWPYTFSLALLRALHLGPGHLTLLITLLHLPWAAVGWFQLFKKLGVRSSLASAAALSLCGGGAVMVFTSVWIFCAAYFAWMPWLLLGMVRLLDVRFSASAALTVSLSIGAILCIGHPQFAFYIILWCGAWVGAYSLCVPEKRVFLKRCFVPLVSGVFLAAPAWWPLLEIYPWAIRSQGMALRYFLARSASWQICWGILWPLFDINNEFLFHRGSLMMYQGVWVLPLLVLGFILVFIKPPEEDSLGRCFFLSLVLGFLFLIFAMGPQGGIYPLTYKIPLWSSFRWPFRFLLVALPSLGLSAGLALELWTRHGESLGIKARGGLILAFVICFVSLVCKTQAEGFPIGVRMLVLCGAILSAGATLFLWKPHASRLFAAGVFLTAAGTVAATQHAGLVTYAESYGDWGPQALGIDPAYRVLPVATMEFLRSQRPMMQPLGLMVSATVNGYDSVTGSTGAMTPWWYMRFFESNDTGLLRPSNYTALLPSRFLQAANVRYVLADEGDTQAVSMVEEASSFKKIRQAGHTVVYERPGALPRAYFAASTESFELPAFSKTMFSNQGNLRSAFLEDAGSKKILPPAQILSQTWSLHERSFRVDAPEGGLLLISSTYLPQWQAWVDGLKTPLLRANGMFQGIWVPAGAKEVTVRYQSCGFFLGIALAASGFMGLLLWMRKRAA